MKVEELVIDGFKSYSVRTVITNWDPQFNAITGLNGSGKSNILDAICFVLGITNTTSLRASNLQDLIYKKGQAGVTKASVTITFDNSDKDLAPVAYKNDSKISITRKVSVDSPSSASTKYLINGRKATQKEVSTLLQSVQLNINNPNFLIMQGKITKMLNMKPTQILNLIEEAAGTKSYEAQRDSSEKVIQKKDAKLKTIKETRDLQVLPKLAELSKLTDVVIEYKDRVSERDINSQILHAYQYQMGMEVLSETGSKLEETTSKLQQLEKAATQYEQQFENLTSDINKIKENNNLLSSSDDMKALEAKEQAISNEITRAMTSRESKASTINELKQSIKNKEAEIAHTNMSIEKKKESFEKIQSEFLKEEEDLKKFKELLQKREDLYSTLSTGISSKGSTDAGYTSQLREANKNLSMTKTAIEQARNEIAHLEKQMDPKRLQAHQKELANFEAEIKRKCKVKEAIQEQLKKSGFDRVEYDNLKEEERSLLQQLDAKSRQLMDFTRRDSRFDFQYQNPSQNFDARSVKGLFGELFDLSQDNQRAATALEVCAGFRLFNVVVDSDKTGSLLLQKGGLRKRITFIPLNRIVANVVRSDILNEAKRQAPNKVELALNLIQYDRSVQKAVEYVFGNKLICDDPETAKLVTFNDKIRTGSITLDGDNYDPSGRLSGGSRRVSSSLINQFDRYKELKHEVDRIRNRLTEISQILRNMNQVATESNDIQQKLVSEEYQIDLLTRKLSDSSSANYIKNYEENKVKIQELLKSIETNEIRISDIKKEIEQINKDMSEFNSDGSKKIRELKEEITRMSAELRTREKVMSKRRLQFNEEKVRNEDSLADTQLLNDEIERISTEIPLIEASVEEADNSISEKQQLLDEINDQIQLEKEKIAGVAQELNELTQHLQTTKDRISSNKTEIEKTSGKLAFLRQQQKEAHFMMKEAKQIYDWVDNETQRQKIITEHPNADLDLCQEKIAECENAILRLRSKGADLNIIEQADTLRTLDENLAKKIRKIEEDKEKIQSTIKKLDQYLDTELNKTYEQVSKDFGEIFALLLPASYAKLVKVDHNGDISKGLEVKVQLGSVWKESLVELSGGQRSLVALALIMSLLQFRPAPMYILDEVDAALDLSHTQSIGQLIKTKFKGSQFIVVSLKEGMFTNANRLFKVRFQDGTSVVSSS